MEKTTIIYEENGSRIDKYLSNNTELSRTLISKMIDDEYILVDNKKTKNNYKVKENSNLNVTAKYSHYNDYEFALSIDFLNGVKTIEEDVEVYYYDSLIDTFKVYYDDFTLNINEEPIHMYIDETYKISYEKSGLSEPIFELYNAYDLVSGDFIDVSEDGVITSKDYGLAKVKVTYGSIEKILNVYVDPYDIDFEDYYSIYTGETLKFNYKCDVEGITPTYSSKNESVLTINEDGFMTGIAKGQANVTLTIKGYTYTILVRVLESKFVGANNMGFLLEDDSPKKVELIYEGYEFKGWYIEGLEEEWKFDNNKSRQR